MTVEQSDFEKNKLLTQMIRRVAREQAYEVLDEHLEDYEHTPKKTDDMELES